MICLFRMEVLTSYSDNSSHPLWPYEEDEEERDIGDLADEIYKRKKEEK